MPRRSWRAHSDPIARLLCCHDDLFSQRLHCDCCEHVQNFAATSATLETFTVIFRTATALLLPGVLNSRAHALSPQGIILSGHWMFQTQALDLVLIEWR